MFLALALALIAPAAQATQPAAGGQAPGQSAPRTVATPSGSEGLPAVTERVRSFRGETAEVRLPWIRELGRFPETAATDLLLELLAREPVPAVRTAIVRLLGGRTGARVVAALVAELDSASDPIHLEAAALAAARAGEAGVAAVLERCAAQKDARKREPLLRALGYSGSPAAWPLLLRTFDEGTPVDRLHVLESLRGQPATPELTKRRRSALADTFPALKAEGLLQLGLAGDPIARAAALAAVKSADPRLRSAAAAVLGSGLTPQEMPVWLEAAAFPQGDLLPGVEATFARIRGDPALVAWILRNGTSAKEPAAQALCVRILAGVAGPEATGALLAAAGRQDPLGAEVALRSLAARKDPASLEPLRKLFAEARPPERRASLLRALQPLCRDELPWRNELVALASSGAPPLRCAALDALAGLGLAGAGADDTLREAAAAAAAACLSHESWPVRSAALGCLLRVRSAAALDALIARVGKEDGRLERELLDVLDAWTGRTFADAAAWRQWWKEAKGSFVPAPAADLAAARRPSAGATVAYYDIPLTSRRVVFCLDVSASMRNTIGTGGVTRLAEAQRELANAIERADPEVWLNLVFFDEEPRLFEPKLVKATKDTRQKALAFVRKTEAMGGTNLMGALEKAFEDPRVDTIYVLSDGQPSAGRTRSPDVIAEEVERWNHTRRVVIHCVSVGSESALLRRLAESTGGQHVVRM